MFPILQNLITFGKRLHTRKISLHDLQPFLAYESRVSKIVIDFYTSLDLSYALRLVW